MRNDKRNQKGESYRAYVTTHRGKVRRRNEDNFVLNSINKRREYDNVNHETALNAPLLAAVFDGMGGESMGDTASYISSKEAKYLYSELQKGGEISAAQLAAEFSTRANNKIRDMLEENRCSTGGSTVAAVMIKNEIAYPFSLGDSRVYLFRNSRLSQITEDHTLAAKKLAAKLYTPEEAAKSLDSHRLLHFLGVDYERKGIAPQCYEAVVLQKSDKLLLCSDGLYNELSSDEMRGIIKNNPDNPTLELVKAALIHGGRDNITAVLIEREI